MRNEPNQVLIDQVKTDVVITEGIGPLSRADVQQLVSVVLQHIRHEQDRNAQRERDTTITNAVFPSHIR
ncbi:MAG: hypothetical protein JO340_03615 [Acidobacteriaceae bacterium]|nr:hypothetical protein [Acidobacteriaceae bacterium]